jgi:integrase
VVDKSRRIPAYRLHKPTRQAVVRLDGRDHYLGKHGSEASREKYRRTVAEWLTASVAPSATDPPGPPVPVLTVAEIILAFWRHAEVHYRASDGTPSEELGNIKGALRPLRALYGETLARDFGPLALRAVRDEMVRSGLARTSVNARVDRIRRAFRWAASVELVPPAVVQALATVAGLQKGRTTAREADPVGPVPVDHVEKTLPYLSRPVASLVRLQLLTGMRPGEACSMRGWDLTPGDEMWTYRRGSHRAMAGTSAPAISDQAGSIAYPNSGISGVPVLIWKGRPTGSRTSVLGSIPRAWRMVAPRSSGLTGSREG